MLKRLAAICALLVVPLLMAPLPARADPYVDGVAVDALLAELAVASSQLEADAIAQDIWGVWTTPADSRLATRMSVASNMLGEGHVEASLEELDGIVAEYPGYAEGWNQRATLFYMLGQFARSLADIDRVLAIEPRHFGALAGRVLIHLKQGHRDAALADMRAALAIHPYLSERRLFPELAEAITHV